jgi:hypothetical protein
MISWFRAFAFKWVNLCRYTADEVALVLLPEVGLYKLNPADPYLESALWFQPLNL